jgi:hypothetical protein
VRSEFRLRKLEAARWEVGSILPPGLRDVLSAAEQDYFTAYGKLVSAYQARGCYGGARAPGAGGIFTLVCCAVPVLGFSRHWRGEWAGGVTAAARFAQELAVWVAGLVGTRGGARVVRRT